MKLPNELKSKLALISATSPLIPSSVGQGSWSGEKTFLVMIIWTLGRCPPRLLAKTSTETSQWSNINYTLSPHISNMTKSINKKHSDLDSNYGIDTWDDFYLLYYSFIRFNGPSLNLKRIHIFSLWISPSLSNTISIRSRRNMITIRNFNNHPLRMKLQSFIHWKV